MKSGGKKIASTFKHLFVTDKCQLVYRLQLSSRFPWLNTTFIYPPRRKHSYRSSISASTKRSIQFFFKNLDPKISLNRYEKSYSQYHQYFNSQNSFKFNHIPMNSPDSKNPLFPPNLENDNDPSSSNPKKKKRNFKKPISLSLSPSLNPKNKAQRRNKIKTANTKRESKEARGSRNLSPRDASRCRRKETGDQPSPNSSNIRGW